MVPWTDPEGQQWLLRLHFAVVAGRFECVGMSLRSYLLAEEEAAAGDEWEISTEPAKPLSAQHLRQIPLGRLVGQVRREAADVLASLSAADIAADDVAMPTPEEVSELVGQWRAENKGRGPRVPLDEYRRVALAYTRGYRTGAPVEAVQQEFGLSRGGAEKRVAKARRLGFLPPTKPGRQAVRSAVEVGRELARIRWDGPVSQAESDDALARSVRDDGPTADPQELQRLRAAAGRRSRKTPKKEPRR